LKRYKGYFKIGYKIGQIYGQM